MAFLLKDRVKETTTTTGTGALTLGGASATFDTFASVCLYHTTYYAMVHTTMAQMNIGLCRNRTLRRMGTICTGNMEHFCIHLLWLYPQRSRLSTTVLSSYQWIFQLSATNFSAGDKDVFITYPADKGTSAVTVGSYTVGGKDGSGNVTISQLT